jgi:hypothetical protein
MFGKITLSATERKVLNFIVLSDGIVQQTEIIDAFSHNYNTPDSAKVAIGNILRRLLTYELIEHHVDTQNKFKKNENLWKLTQKGKYN